VSGNKLEKEILSIFNRDISSFLSINQISKRLKKSYPYINIKVNQLIEEGVLNKASVGKSYQCSINLNNEKAVALLSLNEVEKKEIVLKKLNNYDQLETAIYKLRKEFKIYSLLLSKNTLIFILDYLHDKEAIIGMAPEITKYDLLFFDKVGFQQYVLKNSNILVDLIILYSFEKYFEFINDIKDQLTIKNINAK
jgi:DNA-binding Lrp family transcriptional regulator